MTERDIQNAILAAHSRGGTRLIRVNAGQAYNGRVIEQTPTRLVLSPWYPIRLAAEGVSDLLGWTSIPDASGAHTYVAVFTAIEVKSKTGRATAEQLAFIETVRDMGGRAGIARSVSDAGLIIAGK